MAVAVNLAELLDHLHQPTLEFEAHGLSLEPVHNPNEAIQLRAAKPVH